MDNIERKDNIGGTEIYVCDGVAPVKEWVTQYIEGGLIAILYDVKLKDYADSLSSSFRGSNHTTVATCLAEEIPVHTRFVIGIGAGRIAGEVRRKSTALGVDCAMVFSAPTTDTILSPNQSRNLNAVFLDRGLIDSCPKECVASGWGIILSEPLRNFEDYYAERVLDEKGIIANNLCLTCENNRINLAYCLLSLSATRLYQDNASIMAEVLFDNARRGGRKPRLMGEYKFISASVIACLYESYLSSPSIDCAIPPAHDLGIDDLAKFTGRSMSNLLKAFDFFQIDGYFRVGYILSEYRLDLLERLRAVDFHSAQKRWRRIYPDAGYWLKGAFTTKLLYTAMRLSAEIGHGLLRYILESGFAKAC